MGLMYIFLYGNGHQLSASLIYQMLNDKYISKNMKISFSNQDILNTNIIGGKFQDAKNSLQLVIS